jgi:hypothetical protein
MQLTVVFEHWHLGDGNYPAFALGDLARLSFELDSVTIAPAASDSLPSLTHIRDAEYECVARVLRTYPDGIDSHFAVFEADWLRFYSSSMGVAALKDGDTVALRGTFALDHYMWVEFLDRYPDPPDLFYGVRVMRIRRVRIPESFIHRGEKVVSHPTSLGPPQYDANTLVDVEEVEEPDDGPAFSILNLELLPPGTGPAQPTFFAQ